MTPQVDQRSASTQPIKIVPKGLRSFDAGDADFFLELLPGPRDREGLPDSIRFWKTRIEALDPDVAFSVGLIYGPSGCGKSSLMKAGLLPRLRDHVTAIYVEATAADTEQRLLHALQKRCLHLPLRQGLKDTLASLRRGEGTARGKKVLIVLDQFEQWLHAKREETKPELVQALRQCDGEHVQCLLLVRDDFWLAIGRFMRELEVPLVEGKNSVLVDLFDQDHAQKVLAALGRAFGKLPENPRDMTRQQRDFVRQAIQGLSNEGKVVCVRLALFAEMMKGRPWLSSTLREVGGIEGIGVTFLEETFSGPTAPPSHRFHQRAARAVLQTLLSGPGADIKGRMRSEEQLKEASGYAQRPRDFEDLMRILDGDLRLITPADPEGRTTEADQPGQAISGMKASRCYQLTHDYLVPSLRDWLTRKQKETPRGRARLLLADRAGTWSSKPENRLLPSSLEWLRIRLLSRPTDWTASERGMMQAAGKYYGLRAALLGIALIGISLSIRDYLDRLHARNLVKSLLSATTEEVPKVVAEMEPYRRRLDPLLREAQVQAGGDAKKQLHLSIALLPSDAGQVECLYGRLLEIEPPDFNVVISALMPYRTDLVHRLWNDIRRQDPEQSFRAAAALASLDPDDPKWADLGAEVAARLFSMNPLLLAAWQPSFQPVGRYLLSPLADFIEQENRSPSEGRTLAAVYRAFTQGSPAPCGPLERKLNRPPPTAPTLEDETSWAKRKANVAAALAAMGKTERVRPLLIHSEDDTLRSWLVERLATNTLDHLLLADWLTHEIDDSIVRSLILSLGSVDQDRLSQTALNRIRTEMIRLYGDHPDPGVHSAVAWAMRRWSREPELKPIESRLCIGKPVADRSWYYTRDGDLYVIIKDLNLAVSATEVTVAQYQRFQPRHKYAAGKSPTPSCPMNQVSWFEAAQYCNWLSEHEGIPRDQWCYQPNEAGQYAEGMQISPGYQRLDGYRLPEETEWERACLAGAARPWACGVANDELIGYYARFFINSHVNGMRTSSPAGTYKPNDYGLYDMHGNVAEWCQDPDFQAVRVGAKSPSKESLRKIEGNVLRVQRGGTYNLLAAYIKATSKVPDQPSNTGESVGFRPVRKIPR